MRSRGRASATAITLVSLVGLWVLLTLPVPLETVHPPAGWALAGSDPVAGAFHLHTKRSDGYADPDQVAEAASRAGLQFVILTDHGDATRAPDAPRYHSGVLILDAVEISTSGGHYIAVGLPQAPYPLGGSAVSVVEDVRRLGGFGIIAHPTSPKEGLAWLDTTLDADGIEWLNGDSEWRDESAARLVMAAGHYLFRSRETLASLLDRPTEALAAWDRATARRSVVGLAGHDAHAPAGYETLFGTFTLRVELEHSLTGDPTQDANSLVAALRSGRVYTAIDAFAAPPRLRFEGRIGGKTIPMGERVVFPNGLELRASAVAPAGSRLVLMANGNSVSTVNDSELRYTVPSRTAAYRVEVQIPSAPGTPAIPWIVSNPIYVGPAVPPDRINPLPPINVLPLAGKNDRSLWAVEHDVNSTATVTENADRVTLTYDLATTRSNQFAAAVRSIPLGLLNEYDGIAFNIKVNRPARVFFQIRSGTVAGLPRWQKSFYADATSRRIAIAFVDLKWVHASYPTTVDLARSDALLLVVDLTHASPGDAATVVIETPQLERWR